MNDKQQALDDENINFIHHLTELRTRLIKILIFIGFISLALCYYANEIYHLIALPLLKYLPSNSHLIATSITSPLFTPFKLAFIVAVFLAIPFILYQVWGF